MPLHSAVLRNGLINESGILPVTVEADECRLIVFKEKLYCFYLNAPTRVFYISRGIAGGWSQPEDVGVESITGMPALFIAQDRLHVYASGMRDEYDVEGKRTVYPGEGAKIAVFDAEKKSFEVKDVEAVLGSPSVVAFKDKLYRFSRFDKDSWLFTRESHDGERWWPGEWVRGLGADSAILKPTLDPVACLYQGLIHVFHKTTEGLSLIRFDGQSRWSRSQLFLDAEYSHMPSVVVHDGMLTLAFANTKNTLDNTISVHGTPTEVAMGDDAVEGTLDLYRYDGNVLGKVDRSIDINANGAPNAVVFNGELHLFYPSA